MKNFFAYLAACMAILCLNACATQEAKLPHVSLETVSHTVLFTNTGARIPVTERDSLSDFLKKVPPSAASYVLLETSDLNKSAVAHARSVQNYIVAQGFSKKIIRLQPTPNVPTGTVGVYVQYSKSHPPEPCPDWSKNSIADYDNTDHSNFGCAYYNNMTVQLANPADYDNGHGTPMSESSRDSAAMQRYMSGAAASTSTPSTSGAAAAGSTTTTTSSTP